MLFCLLKLIENESIMDRDNEKPPEQKNKDKKSPSLTSLKFTDQHG